MSPEIRKIKTHKDISVLLQAAGVDVQIFGIFIIKKFVMVLGDIVTAEYADKIPQKPI
jgi:hypothetical protein